MAEGDGDYVTIASVRRTSGILVTEITDADVGAIIAEVEPQVERYFNTVFTPKERIDTLDGNGTNRIFLDKNPVLAVRDLYIDGDQEDTDNLQVYKESGKIVLGPSASVSTFKELQQAIVVKYLYGWLEESSVSSTTSAAEETGTDVSIALVSITAFADEDWVEIYGMDGNREVAQINATPGAGAIVVDQLVYDHVLGSTVTLLQVNANFTKLMNILCAIAMVARIIGESYTDIVGYNIAEMRVQKGEPYTQWRETALQLNREKEEIMKRIRPRPVVI